jgi:hypothetical protein
MVDPLFQSSNIPKNKKIDSPACLFRTSRAKMGTDNKGPGGTMNLYFLSEQNEVVGPMSSDALHGLFNFGTIAENTLVAKEGDEEWTPYRVRYPKQERAVIKEFPNPPSGIRDEMVGIKKFNERTYPNQIDIALIAKETESHFAKSGIGKTIRRENAELIEIVVERMQKEEPLIVSICKIGDGFRISFLRTSGVTKVLKSAPLALVASLLFPPALIVGSLTQASIAGLERREETLFWDFMESRIAELALKTSALLDSTPEDVASKLAKLWQLKVDGALTPEEFEAEKKLLLKRQL